MAPWLSMAQQRWRVILNDESGVDGGGLRREAVSALPREQITQKISALYGCFFFVASGKHPLFQIVSVGFLISPMVVRKKYICLPNV